MGKTAGGAGAVDFEEDVAAGGFPDVTLGGEVALGEIAFDGAYKLGDTGKAALAHGVLGEVAEETLDQVHPRARGWGEVKDDAFAVMGLALAAVPVGDPTFDLGVLVGGVIVDDEMECEISRGFGIEMLEEGQPLVVRVARRGLAEDLAVEAC